MYSLLRNKEVHVIINDDRVDRESKISREEIHCDPYKMLSLLKKKKKRKIIKQKRQLRSNLVQNIRKLSVSHVLQKQNRTGYNVRFYVISMRADLPFRHILLKSSAS